MRPVFSEIKYERPDFAELSAITQKLLFQIRKKHNHSAEMRELFEAYSNLYLQVISMYHLALLRRALSDPDSFYQAESEFLKKQLNSVKEGYYAVFSAVADSQLVLSDNPLKNSAIMNQARRIGRTYSKVDLSLLKREHELINDNEAFFNQVFVSVDAEIPSAKHLAANYDDPPEKNYSVYLHDLTTWLRQGRGKVRRKLFHAFSGELQNYTFDNNKRFNELLMIRKAQAEQSRLSYFDFIIASQKGYLYSRKDVIQLKQNLMTYFMPLFDEIRKLRNQRFNLDETAFYDEYKLSRKNPVFLLDPALDKEKTMRQAISNILGGKDSFVFEMIEKGYWNADGGLQRNFKNNVVLLPVWNILYLLLSFSDDYFNLEDDFFLIGEALSDLSGMVNMKGITTYEQSGLIRKVSGYALQFLSRRQMHLFAGEDAELFNDLTLSNELMKIPQALAVDTFESTIYEQNTMDKIDLSALWKQIEKNYHLDFRYLADGFFSEGHCWQLNRDLYLNPFSSLEQAMALIVVLAEQPHKDRHNVLEQKLNALLTSNTDLPFLKRLTTSGFASPFELNTVRKAAFAACDVLRL